MRCVALAVCTVVPHNQLLIAQTGLIEEGEIVRKAGIKAVVFNRAILVPVDFKFFMPGSAPYLVLVERVGPGIDSARVADGKRGT